jgi:hypothetical protein
VVNGNLMIRGVTYHLMGFGGVILVKKTTRTELERVKVGL